MNLPGFSGATYSSLRDTEKERAEQALAASERRFRALIEHAEDGIVLYDGELRVVYRSPAAMRSGDADLTAQLAPLLETPGATACYRFRTSAGRWQEGTATNLLDDPAVAALVVNFRDVHDRVRAERLLRLEHAVAAALARAQGESEGVRAVIREVCEAMDWMAGRFFCAGADGTLRYREGWGVDTDAARAYLEQARKVSYRPGEGLTGLAWQSGEPLWSARVASDPRATGRMSGVHRGGGMVLPVSSQGERLGVLSFVRSEATAPDQELLQALAVMASQVGHFVRAKRSEAVLRESEARFRSLVELSSDWYWEQDEEFRFTRFGGGDAPEALGRRRWELPIEPVSQTWTAHRAVLEAHQPFHGFEYSRDGGDGERRYVEVSGEPMFDAAGAFRGYRGLAKDITARRRVQQEREKVGRMYASLSAVNELVARAETEQELLQVACEIAVSSGEFRYALVRLADEAQGFAPVVAFAGPQQTPRISRPLDLRPGSADAGLLAVRAYRENRNLTDEDEVRVAGAYPLHRGGQCIGVLLLVGGDRSAFTGEMGDLLARMARNVSQGLDRLRADDELRRFRLAVDESADMIALVDCHTLRYLDVNASMCKALGYGREELLAMHPYDILPVSREQLARAYEDIANGAGIPSWVTEYRCKDGSVMPIESSRRVMRSGGRMLMVAIARGIGERLAKEEALRRLTRMYAALSSLNEAISRIRDGQELLQEACEIVASSGDFLRAAVRVLDRATGRTRFVAASGIGVEGLATMEISISAQAAQGPSLVVEALLGGKPVITRDYQNDARTEVARRSAAVSGARSAGAFPLRQGGECTGVLILHGSEPSSFDGDMQALLERMAENISFGLDHIAAELRDRRTFELASTGIAHVGLDGRYLRANPALCAMLGYTASELAGTSVKDISHPDDRDVADAARQRLHRGEIAAVQCEKRYRRKDGSTIWTALNIALARDLQGNPDYEITVVQDITRRTHEERLLALEHAVTRCLAENEDPGSALRHVMQLVCVSESWAAGRYFALDEAAGVMRLEAGWTMPGSAMAGFMEGSRPLEYRLGQGLIGRCWERGEPLWVPDVTADPRVANVALARQAGVHGAFVFPIGVEGSIMGVASISSREVREPDTRLLDTVRVIGAQIGQYLQRKRGDAERAALRERDRSLVSALGEIIYDWRPAADRLIWEGDFTRILGYADMGGDTHSWTSRVHPEDAAAVQAEVDAAARERRNYDLQYRFRHREGHYLWMHDRGVCSFDAEGRVVRIIGVLADVTARKKAEQALRGIVQASAEPLLLVRKDGTTQFVNPAAEALFGRSAKDLEGAPLGLPIADGRPAEVEIVLPDGGVRPAEMQYAATELEGEELMVVSLHDLSERKRYESHIEHLANHDALTGLPNRTLLGDRVEQAIAHARRNGGHVGLMFVDLDQFKLVNDSWGHATGDRLLLEVARRLQATVRDGDSVARLGGDEFVVLLPDLARADSTSVVARKVAEALEKPLVLDAREMRITASIGIALFPDDGDSLDSLLQCADAAMYRAKDAGRNGYQYYSADMGAQARARVETEAGLRLALARNELRLHYQPQVGLEGGEVRGFEALMRWEHPSRGMVSPADFIPVAEESGLIMPMGDWALLTACREAAAWAAGGFGSLRIAVNLSARQFWRGSVTESVRKALGESGLPPSQLEIEITESVVARDLQHVMLQLEQLRRLGVSIAIDDFGTGYSSLAYLRSLPINKLKIDKSFIKGIPGDREATALVGEIIRLAHILSLEVVAEGVETEAQAGLLRQAGCEAMQGYLFARPMPGAECAALLRTGRRLRFNG